MSLVRYPYTEFRCLKRLRHVAAGGYLGRKGARGSNCDVSLKGTTSGVDCAPVGGLAEHPTVQANDEAPRPALDFADLVVMPVGAVRGRCDDAVQHRLLTGAAAPTSLSSHFNLKAALCWRNNVVRAVAPTVARAFAQAASAGVEGAHRHAGADDSDVVFALPPGHVQTSMLMRHAHEQQHARQQQRAAAWKAAFGDAEIASPGGLGAEVSHGRRQGGRGGGGRNAPAAGSGRRGGGKGAAAWT